MTGAGYEPVGRIRPVAPQPSLLTSARQLPADVNWSTGISWVTSCASSYAWPRCQPANPTPKHASASQSRVHTVPFVIYTPIMCEMPDAVAGELDDIANVLTDVHTAFQLADALWMGTALDSADTEIPTLRRAAHPVNLGGAALDLDDGVASLLTHYEMCTDGNGGAMIHMPSTLLPYALGGGAGGGRICWPEGTLYRGPLMSVIVPGPGYPLGFSAPGPFGNGPITSAPGVTPEQYAGNDNAQSWIYVTGPVEYQVSPVRVLPEAEKDRIPFQTNRYEVWGERDAIVRFDPCCAFAVEVINPAPLPEVS